MPRKLPPESTRFAPGKSGNPKGRPRKLPHLDKLLADVLGEERDGMTAAQAVLRSLLVKATRGDVRAAEVLLDRGYGKARQRIDVRVGDLDAMTDDQLRALADGKVPT
jgi:hypothetical protein